MTRGNRMSGTGDNSTVHGPSSNHLSVTKSIHKRSTNVDKKKIVCAAPDLTVPDSTAGTTTVGVNKEEGENKVHGVGKEDEASNKRIDKREKDGDEHFPGFIFMCSRETKPECFKYCVFGLPAGQLFVVQNIKPGTKLFLFDVNLKLLYGVYKATSRGGRDLEPDAFGGRFPAQVRFGTFKESLPLAESVFRHAITENYRGGRKFQQQLSSHQVKKLSALFRHVGEPPEPVPGAPPRHSPPVNIYQNQQPPKDPYVPMAHHRGHHPLPLVSGYIQSATQITNTNPYTRAASGVVIEEANARGNEYNLQLLQAEWKRERKRELVQQFGCASDYSTHPSHAAATAYDFAPSHALPETERCVSPYMPVHHTPHKSVYDASSRALPPPHNAPRTLVHASSQAYVPAVLHNIAPSYANTSPISYDDPSSHVYVPEVSGLGAAYWAAVARENSDQVYDTSAHALPPLHQTPPPLSYDASSQAYVPAALHNIAPTYATPPTVSYDAFSHGYVHEASAQAYVPAALHNTAPSYATPPPVSYDPSSQAHVHGARGLSSFIGQQ